MTSSSLWEVIRRPSPASWLKNCNGVVRTPSATGTPTMPSRPIRPTSILLPWPLVVIEGVAPLMEVDVLDRLIRLDQNAAQFKLDRLQMRLKAREVLSREPCEKLITKG